MVPDVEKIVISITTEEAIMNNKFWNEFYQSGKISDYLNYVNSSEHTARSQREKLFFGHPGRIGRSLHGHVFL